MFQTWPHAAARRGTHLSCKATCMDTCGRKFKMEIGRKGLVLRLKICELRSEPRRYGPLESPIIAAGKRGWRSRVPLAAEIFMIGFMTPSGLNCSSRHHHIASSAQKEELPSATTPPGQCLNLNWR